MPENMEALVGRTERLVESITGAILSTAEAAAERIELASKVAQIQQRMSAFGAVLEAVGAQKAALEARAAALPHGPVLTLLERQVEALTAQELSVLEKAGVPQPVASAALAAPAEGEVYRREGRRFVPVANGRD
jgi:hypothetical protein